MKRRFADHQVREIRTAYAAGIGQRTLATYWNVNRKSIQDIVYGSTYKHVGGDFNRRVRICPHCRRAMSGTKQTATSAPGSPE